MRGITIKYNLSTRHIMIEKFSAVTRGESPSSYLFSGT
jgi:hypothetical protein